MSESPKNLAWDDFRLIKAIADARTLPAAATLVGINHSTVFRRLGQIEAALGVPLFDRHRTGYAPTPAGEEMISLARRMDDDVVAFTRRIVGQEVSPYGELRVTTNDSLLVHLLTPLFAGFRKAFPDVRLDVVLTNQALNLSKRDADVAIRATDHPPETLVGRRAATIGWALYGRAAEFPDGTAPLDDALFGRDWIALGDHLAALQAVKFVRAHVAPERIVYRVNTVLGLAEAMESGLGIGHLPCFIGDARPALVRLAPPDPALTADLWLLTHPDLRQAARVRVFMDFLAAELSKRRRFIAGEDGGAQEQTKASG
jgi:DNA-binding transcriptional LysR family regulator